MFQGNAGRLMPPGANHPQGRGAFAKLRIGDDINAINLQQNRTMADPSDAGLGCGFGAKNQGRGRCR